MPNLSMAPIMPVILDTLQKQADIRNTQANTDALTQRVLMQAQQMQANDQYRQALLNNQPPDPPSSISDSESSASPATRYLSEVDRSIKQTQSKLGLAAKYQQDTTPFETELGHLQSERRAANADVMKEQQEQNKELAYMARDIDSARGLRQFIDYVGETKGKAAAFNLDKQFPHDSQGNLIFNDQAKKTLQPMVSKFMSNKDIFEMKKQEEDLADKKEQRDIARARLKEEERRTDKEYSARMAGIAAAGKRAELMFKRAGMGMDWQQFKTTQQAINKNAEDYKIRDYTKGYEVADRAEKSLLDPARGVQDVTPAAARTLADQYKLMIDNYRRVGGAYQEKEINAMNGVLQRISKFVDNIGRGDEVLAKDAMLNVTREMKKLAIDQNTNLVKQELKYQSGLRARGTSPVPLTTFGDIDMLVQAGRAKQVTVDGKPYLAFGKEKKDWYELPTEPDSVRFMPLEVPTE